MGGGGGGSGTVQHMERGGGVLNMLVPPCDPRSGGCQRGGRRGPVCMTLKRQGEAKYSVPMFVGVMQIPCPFFSGASEHCTRRLIRPPAKKNTDLKELSYLFSFDVKRGSFTLWEHLLLVHEAMPKSRINTSPKRAICLLTMARVLVT